MPALSTLPAHLFQQKNVIIKIYPYQSCCDNCDQHMLLRTRAYASQWCTPKVEMFPVVYPLQIKQRQMSSVGFANLKDIIVPFVFFLANYHRMMVSLMENLLDEDHN